ncbi:hypothetical protein V6N12_062623 [Hibiscus sabdariffa]|uniref:Neprosin domain-containing protein n=1 Tax=Hibiscus sabdariffa TaxID=183260 RepID=A0ABR2F9D8_9ROSI
MVDGLGSWRWDKFSEALPPSILVRISTVKGPTPWPVQVSIGWKGTLGAKFSVRDAYLIWTDHANLTDPSYFTYESADWDLMFGVVVWNLWIDRNTNIFYPERVARLSGIDRSYWLKQAG